MSLQYFYIDLRVGPHRRQEGRVVNLKARLHPAKRFSVYFNEERVSIIGIDG